MGSRYDCVILGSGVIGLSIARELTDRGFRVAVVAKDLAEDAHSTGFASPWAVSNSLLSHCCDSLLDRSTQGCKSVHLLFLLRSDL